jgi:uncharacterized membrane protein
VSTVEALLPQFHRRFKWWVALGVPAFMAMALLFYLTVDEPLPVNL